MEHQLHATITVLLIFKISSTCFGQVFAHLQERKTEIVLQHMVQCPVDVVGRFSERVAWHYVYSMNEAVSRTRSVKQHARKTCLPHQQDIIPYVVKYLSLALLKMGKNLPETC
jgi:hypothetical protein